MDAEKLAKAFDAWMTDFVNNPERFKSMTATALDHMRKTMSGEELTYGQSCSVALQEYLKAV
jgi:hypothetical protein